jgi:hypothetical protein
MIKNNKNTKSKIIRDDPRVIAANAGWNDVMFNRGIDAKYADHPVMGIAVTYMNWRLRAAEVKAKRKKIPRWRTLRQIPHQVKKIVLEVAQEESINKNLSALPLQRMPDDPDLNFV